MEEEKNNIEEVLISRYLSGEATTDEKEQLLQWLETDEKNQRYFNQLENIWQTAYPAFNPDEIDVDEAYDQVIGKLDFAKKDNRFFLWFSRVAAVLFIPLLAVAGYVLLKDTSQGLQEKIAFQEVYAPYGTYSQIGLPDGSLVSLNAGSKLRFPTIFPENQRDVYLDGEAYFEVVSSSEKPFIVHTHKLDVKATGTKFNVEDYSKDTIAAVTMIEGVVNTTISEKETLSLNPGDRILFSKTSDRISLSNTDPYKWYAWKDGILIFRDDPLEYVFKRLNQTFNVNIIIKDTQLASHPYRATFTNESLEEILRLLKMSAPIAFKEIGRNSTDGEIRDKRTIEVYFANAVNK